MMTIDAQLLVQCAAGEEGAWEALGHRFGRLVRLVALRVLDERRPGPSPLEESEPAVERFWSLLRRNEAGPLRISGGSRLDAYLAVLARQEAELFALDETPMARPLDLSRAEEQAGDMAQAPATRIAEVLDRLTPQASAMVRLRLRGLDAGEIATTMGKPQLTVVEGLDRVAGRLAQAQAATDADIAWRLLLDCASLAERVRVAVRTEDDAPFRRTRAFVEATWRRMRDLALVELKPRTPGPLQDPSGIAAFVDGTMRGAERTRAEGHLAVCQRSVDRVAMLVRDLRAGTVLRAADALVSETALAATCVATGRYALAVRLADAALPRDPGKAAVLRRLAQAGLQLDEDAGCHEASQVYSVLEIPRDDEAPVVAFEALVGGDATAAFRAIDEYAAKQTIGQRLRLLALASGTDLPRAQELAREVHALPSPDPGLKADATCVLALPQGRALPREVVVDRLRDAVTDAVRFVASR